MFARIVMVVNSCSSVNGSFVIRRHVRSGTTPDSLPSLPSAHGSRALLPLFWQLAVASPFWMPAWYVALPPLRHQIGNQRLSRTAPPTGGISTVDSGARWDRGTFRCIPTTRRGVCALHFAEPPLFREEVHVRVKWA